MRHRFAQIVPIVLLALVACAEERPVEPPAAGPPPVVGEPATGDPPAGEEIELRGYGVEAPLGRAALVTTLEPWDTVRYPDLDDYQAWYDSAISVGLGGTIYTTDYGMSQISLISDYEDGDTIRWEYFRPDGSASTSLSVGYDGTTMCWTGGLCGNFAFVYWYPLLRSSAGPEGTWSVDAYLNNQFVYTEFFEMVGTELSLEQAPSPEAVVQSVAPEPFRVRLVDVDGSSPMAGERVTFQFTSTPNQATGFGLVSSPEDPPIEPVASFMHVDTDANGEAEVYIVTGDKEGDYVVEATNRYDTDAGPDPRGTVAAVPLLLGVASLQADHVELRGLDKQFLTGSVDANGPFVISQHEFGMVDRYTTTIPVELEAHPYPPGWEPDVEWDYRFSDKGGWTTGGSFTGFSGELDLYYELPAPAHDQFGNQAFTVLALRFTFSGPGGQLNTQELSLWPKLFFDKYGDDDGDGRPNWVQYWSQVPEIAGLEGWPGMTELLDGIGVSETDLQPGFSEADVFYRNKNHAHVYSPSLGDHGFAYCGFTDLYVGPISGEPSGSAMEGIDNFARTIIHEHAHLTYCYEWWGASGRTASLDQNNNQVPDSQEAEVISEWANKGLIPASWDDGNLDDTGWMKEAYAYAIEELWDDGSIADIDWAWPGSQTEYVPGTSTP